MKLSGAVLAIAALLAASQDIHGAGPVLNATKGKASDIISKIAKNAGGDAIGALSEEFGSIRFSDAGGVAAGERLAAFATMSDAGFDIVVVAEGTGETPAFDDIGGDIVMQLRRGMKNGEADGAPVVFRCFCGRQEQPPPMLYGAFYGMTDSKAARMPGSRIERLVPAYFSSGSPSPLPEVSFKPMRNGWTLTFSFKWAEFFDDLPFADKGRPMSWRLCIRRTRQDGSVALLGSIDSPVSLAWGKGSPGQAMAVRKAVVCDKSCGERYETLLGELDFWHGGFKAERHIGFFDTGRETFEQKNPASDEAFYESFFVPFREWNRSLQEALHIDNDGSTRKPPAVDMPKATFDEIYGQLSRVFYASEGFAALRRDYLLARFTGVDKPAFAAPKQAGAATPPNKQEVLAAPTMDIDGTGQSNGLIELDDIAF